MPTSSPSTRRRSTSRVHLPSPTQPELPGITPEASRKITDWREKLLFVYNTQGFKPKTVREASEAFEAHSLLGERGGVVTHLHEIAQHQRSQAFKRAGGPVNEGNESAQRSVNAVVRRYGGYLKGAWRNITVIGFLGDELRAADSRSKPLLDLVKVNDPGVAELVQDVDIKRFIEAQYGHEDPAFNPFNKNFSYYSPEGIARVEAVAGTLTIADAEAMIDPLLNEERLRAGLWVHVLNEAYRQPIARAASRQALALSGITPPEL